MLYYMIRGVQQGLLLTEFIGLIELSYHRTF
jgi:hypothetical protein